ncbi:hypothetical protein VTO73DRAFT_5266 [Trametes versicolor]
MQDYARGGAPQPLLAPARADHIAPGLRSDSKDTWGEQAGKAGGETRLCAYAMRSLCTARRRSRGFGKQRAREGEVARENREHSRLRLRLDSPPRRHSSSSQPPHRAPRASRWERPGSEPTQSKAEQHHQYHPCPEDRCAYPGGAGLESTTSQQHHTRTARGPTRPRKRARHHPAQLRARFGIMIFDARSAKPPPLPPSHPSRGARAAPVSPPAHAGGWRTLKLHAPSAMPLAALGPVHSASHLTPLQPSGPEEGQADSSRAVAHHDRVHKQHESAGGSGGREVTGDTPSTSPPPPHRANSLREGDPGARPPVRNLSYIPLVCDSCRPARCAETPSAPEVDSVAGLVIRFPISQKAQEREERASRPPARGKASGYPDAARGLPVAGEYKAAQERPDISTILPSRGAHAPGRSSAHGDEQGHA